jgi:uncharacterized protein RhaS with RHS repeats
MRGDLLTLTDGRSKTTTWTYTPEGDLESKKYHGQAFANLIYGYNANAWLTSRRFYSSATVFQETAYGYDDVGNRTSITYPAGTTSLSYQYKGVESQHSDRSDPFNSLVFSIC